MCVLPALVLGAGSVSQSHIGEVAILRDQAVVNHGLIGTGSLPAGTLDFLGDTLGSFSSLQIAPGSWRRVNGHYEAILWTLPDRGRNDPQANLFYDYASRLHRFRISFTPGEGRLTLQPQGGMTLRDSRNQPFTGADPGQGTVLLNGVRLPAPAAGTGAGKISLDAESLQFTRAGSFYVGDEYAVNVYFFDERGRMQGVIRPPEAIEPRRDGRVHFSSLRAPDTGRRNNQGVEGISLSPDGSMLFVALQSALMQDSAEGNASGRINTRILVYDVRSTPVPSQPVGHYVVQLPMFDDGGNNRVPNGTAAQSEIRALDSRRFLMLARDGAGVGADDDKPAVYKKVLLVDIGNATNLAGSRYETDTQSVLSDRRHVTLRPDIQPATWVELIDLLDPLQLVRVGLRPELLSSKWEAMDLVPALDPDMPNDWFLLIGNDNDFIARRCVMAGQSCDSHIDNDNRVLVYRLTLPY